MNIINILKPKAKNPQELLSDKEKQWSQTLAKGVVSVKDIIAPPAIEVDLTTLKLAPLTSVPYLSSATQGMFRLTGSHR